MGILLLLGVVAYYDAGAAAGALRDTRWWLAIPAIAGLMAVHLLGAATWRVLTSAFAGVEIPWGAAVRTYYAAQALGTITPAGIGADAYRARATWAERREWRHALAPVAVHRGTSYFSLIAFSAVAVLFVPVSTALRVGLASVAVLALAVAVTALIAPRHRPRARRFPARALWKAVALSAAFHIAAVALTYLIVLALDAHSQPARVLPALMVARLATFVPLTPSGLGFQEGAFALLLPEAGVSAETAVAASAVTRLAMLLTIVAGGFVLASSRGRHVAGPDAISAIPAPSRR